MIMHRVYLYILSPESYAMVPGLMTITFAHFSGVPDLKMPEPFSQSSYSFCLTDNLRSYFPTFSCNVPEIQEADQQSARPAHRGGNPDTAIG